MSATQFQIVDMGIGGPDGIQDFGVLFTPFSDCVVGVGDCAADAYEDALEHMAAADAPAAHAMPHGCGILGAVDPDELGTDTEPRYYIGIRWNPHGHGYFVELSEPGIYQSVFPAPEAEFSQLHTSVEDAVEYIREVAGEQVAVTVTA